MVRFIHRGIRPDGQYGESVASCAGCVRFASDVDTRPTNVHETLSSLGFQSACCFLHFCTMSGADFLICWSDMPLFLASCSVEFGQNIVLAFLDGVGSVCYMACQRRTCWSLLFYGKYTWMDIVHWACMCLLVEFAFRVWFRSSVLRAVIQYVRSVRRCKHLNVSCRARYWTKWRLARCAHNVIATTAPPKRMACQIHAAAVGPQQLNCLRSPDNVGLS